MERPVREKIGTSLRIDRKLYYDAMHRAKLLGYTTWEYVEVLVREDLRKPIEQSLAAMPGEEVKES